MRFEEVKTGRVFIVRLEDGEIVQESIERFALKNEIKAAKVQMLGGVDKGSKLIVGPKQGRAKTIEPMSVELEEMYEAVGNGTIFTNDQEIPKLHCHLACGRSNNTICGDIRAGVIVWHIMEVTITELTNCKSIRKPDALTGFEFLKPDNCF